MTYCVAAIVEEGIVFASDSRTSAGADNIAVFSKMMCWETVGERVIVLLSSGNLATTQSVISLLKMRSKDDAGLPLPNGVLGVKKLYEVAELVGATLREVVQRERSVRDEGVEIDASFIVGGQIDHHTPRLFRVYSEGNFIEASSDTNYFQIGETKYGKPIIDRVVHYGTPMKEVAKSFLVSFDSTMRSNLSVGLPIDLIAYERDAHRVTLKRRFKNGDAYFSRISGVWSAGLRRAFAEVPDVPWVDEPEPVDRRRS
ncbi:MAG TPA: peptidase [Burkholderiales bacterium]|nr:peptidase [Burkholderiales bacterium]